MMLNICSATRGGVVHILSMPAAVRMRSSYTIPTSCVNIITGMVRVRAIGTTHPAVALSKVVITREINSP